MCPHLDCTQTCNPRRLRSAKIWQAIIMLIISDWSRLYYFWYLYISLCLTTTWHPQRRWWCMHHLNNKSCLGKLIDTHNYMEEVCAFSNLIIKSYIIEEQLFCTPFQCLHSYYDHHSIDNHRQVHFCSISVFCGACLSFLLESNS
jgi:hypothetical protein